MVGLQTQAEEAASAWEATGDGDADSTSEVVACAKELEPKSAKVWTCLMKIDSADLHPLRAAWEQLILTSASAILASLEQSVVFELV